MLIETGKSIKHDAVSSKLYERLVEYEVRLLVTQLGGKRALS